MMMLPAMLNAQTQTEDRFTEAFTGISVGSVIEVTITQGDDFIVELQAPVEHMEHIKTEVKNGILNVSYSRRARNLKGLKLFVTAPEFSYLNASGASLIRSEGPVVSPALELIVSGASRVDLVLDAEQLTTNISGASSATLTGAATSHKINVSGVSSVRAYELESRIADVTSSGTASVRITVLEAITAQASGSSSINVRGNPAEATVSTSAAGRVSGVDLSRSVEAPIDEEDTLLIRMGHREVVITEGKRPEVRKRRAQWHNNWSGLYLGINGYMTPGNSFTLGDDAQFMNLEYNNSISVNLNFWQKNLALTHGRNSSFGLYTGLGVSWNNYRFENNIRLVHGDQQLGYFPDSIYDFRKNKLTVSHLNAPLMLEFQTNQRHSRSKFHMSAGVNLGMRLRSHTKYVYRHEGSREKDKEYKSYHLAPFRYEAIAQIGWGSLNLYASYALNSMFKDDRGPELYPFSVGIRLLSF